MKLTLKEEKYCLLLHETVTQRKAYREVFPRSLKWKDKTVDERASRLANTDKIVARLKELQAETRERSQIKIDDVVQKMVDTIMLNICDFYHDDGSVKLLSELSNKQKSALSFYSVKSIHVGGGEYEDVPIFKTLDVDKNRDMLMKHLGGYEKDNKRELTFDEDIANWLLKK